MIEVWEKLDCESVGRAEIEAIEQAVKERFGSAAVDSPMRIARLLADEGAALRHAEIMQLWVERARERPHEAEFRNLFRLDSIETAARSLRHAENQRLKYLNAGDSDGLRQLRAEAIEAKTRLQRAARAVDLDPRSRLVQIEIAEWLTLWLQSPELFENWIKLRKKSADFIKRFGE